MRVHYLKSRITAKVVSVLLCVTVLCSVFAFQAFALDGKTGNLSWTLSGGTLTISGNGDMIDYSDGNLPPWFSYTDSINRIVVREGVTSIGSIAFCNCSKATAIALPSTVTSIGDRAFKNCSSVTYIKLPSGLVSIGEASFEYCKQLKSIYLPSGLETIGDYAFVMCYSLSSITVPESVTSLGRIAFAYCKSLVRANILCEIKKVPDCLFFGCTVLSDVCLQSTVETIGESAFEKCSDLSKIYYKGEKTAEIEREIYEEYGMTVTPAFTDEDMPEAKDYSYVTANEKITITSDSYSESSDAEIVVNKETVYTYLIEGQTVTVEEANAARADNVNVDVESESSCEITAVIKSEAGWETLANAITEAEKTASEQIEVSVNFNGNEISADSLKELASTNASIVIKTENGNAWELDGSIIKKREISESKYNLDYTVEKIEEKTIGSEEDKIEGETVYKVDFQSDVDYPSAVGVSVKMGDAFQYATLYEGDITKEVEELQTVVVDTDGKAWFYLANVSDSTDYYVVVNSDKADTSSAIIPDQLRQSYGIDYDTSSILDKYVTTGSTSSWGITSGQFTLIILIGVVVLCVIIAVIFIVNNEYNKIKYRAANDATASEEDKELQAMRDLLDELNKPKD